MSSENRAVFELKEQANTLKFAISLASNYGYNFSSNEPLQHQPSLQQCLESISHAYGFKSYNGFLQAQTLDHVFNSNKLIQSVVSQLREVNNFEAMGVRSASWWLALNKDEKIAQKASELFNYLESLPFKNDLKLPQMIYTDVLNISGYEHARRGTDSHLRFAEYVLSHIVEGLAEGRIEKHETEGGTLYFLPLSRLYKHKIVGDLNQARSIIKYIVDDINLSGILSAHEGGLEFVDHHNSVINIVVKSDLAKELEKFSKVNAVMDELLGMFHSLLEIYPKPVIDFKKVNKLKGYDNVKYTTYKYYLIKILLGLVYDDTHDDLLTGVEQKIKQQYSHHSKSKLVIRNMETISHSILGHEGLYIERIASINPHSHLIREAITKFDDCFARYIYPLFAQERELMVELKEISNLDGNVKKEDLPRLVQTASLGRLKTKYENMLYLAEDAVVSHKVDV